jgi:hypothetical protein
VGSDLGKLRFLLGCKVYFHALQDTGKGALRQAALGLGGIPKLTSFEREGRPPDLTPNHRGGACPSDRMC